MSIDSIRFIHAGDVTREIARLLRPGGRAVITTWESLTEVPLETVVPDYRPYLEAAGLLVRRHEVVQNARERELQYYNELLSRSTALREEIGAAAEPILGEAEAHVQRAAEPPRVRKVLIVAQAAELAL